MPISRTAGKSASRVLNRDCHEQYQNSRNYSCRRGVQASGQLFLALNQPVHLIEALLESEISTLINHDYKMGQSSSLKLGLSMVRADHQSVMFLLADQPMTDASMINRLIKAFLQSSRSICVPVSGGRRGNPVIFGRNYFEALMATRGDQGGREIIRNHAHDVLEVEIENPHAFTDIDTPADLAGLNARKD